MLATRWTPSRVREIIRPRLSRTYSPVQLLGDHARTFSPSPRAAGLDRLGRFVGGDEVEDALQVALEDGEVVGDVGQRVVDLVGHARREEADRGELLGLGEDLAHPLALGLVADRADELDAVGQARSPRATVPSGRPCRPCGARSARPSCRRPGPPASGCSGRALARVAGAEFLGHQDRQGPADRPPGPRHSRRSARRPG